MFEDREAYLTELCTLIWNGPLAHLEAPRWRVAMGSTSGRASRTVAICYARRVSTDDTSEIFVNPEVDDPVAIAAALVHECIHAWDDCRNGHRGPFAEQARRVGLDGPLTATHASPALAGTLEQFCEALGPFPHARLDLKQRPKQSTRMLKVQCRAADCLFTFRAARQQLAKLSEYAPCPACGSRGTLQHD